VQPVDVDAAARRVRVAPSAGEHVEQRRLAAAARTHHGDEVAGLDLARHAAQDVRAVGRPALQVLEHQVHALVPRQLVHDLALDRSGLARPSEPRHEEPVPHVHDNPERDVHCHHGRAAEEGVEEERRGVGVVIEEHRSR